MKMNDNTTPNAEQSSTLTDAQKQFRIGRFTGSEIHKLMSAKGIGKTGETYIFEKAAEFLTGEPIKPEFTAQSTQWGIDHELEAQLYFQSATGLIIDKCDTLDNGSIVGTPDGLIKSELCGFEIKCPFNSSNHLRNFLMSGSSDLEDLRPEYYWQIVAYMWLTGYNKWKFCSYDPRFKDAKRMLILNIDLNKEHLEALKHRVSIAKEMFDSIITKLNPK
jgi:hypothetical protein